MLLKTFIASTACEIIELKNGFSTDINFDIVIAPVFNEEKKEYEIRVVDPERFPHASRIKFTITV